MAYKVASGVSALAGALKAITPEGQAILAIGAVAGVITGIGTAVKKAANDAKRANLDAHFGDIVLSLSDLQEIAAHIVQNEDLDMIRESVLAMDEAEGIADSIKDTTAALNKMNWKISMGMELGEAEKEEYRSQIESYIVSTQEYLTQKQYAVNIAVGVLTDDDLEGSNIIDKVNQFYASRQNELQQLGTELNNLITEAFNDGLLDIYEVPEITKLQSQMAEIQNALTEAEYDANLELMKMDYLNGGALDADSFMNLQAELGEQTAAASEEYRKAFVMATSNARLMFREGDIDQTEYDRMTAVFQDNYLEQTAELQARASNFQNQVIREQYADEIGNLDVNGVINKVLEDKMEYISQTADAGIGWEVFSNNNLDYGLSKSTTAALSDLWEEMRPQFEQQQKTIEEYKAAGMAVPESIRQGMLDSAEIGALVGDQNAIYTMMGEEARTNPEYQAMMEDLQEQGTYIPEQIAAGIRQNRDVVQKAVLEACNVGITQGLPRITTAGYVASPGTGMPGHADGGIFTVPHVAWFAEDGPEAAIPLDGSRNAIELWEKTGELLGMDGLSGGAEPLTASIEEAAYAGSGETVIQVDNSRTMQFYGSAPPRDELEEILEDEDEKFAIMMQRYLGHNRRVRFS